MRILLTCLSFLVPLQAFAVTGYESLQTDISLFEDSMKFDEEEQLMEDREAAAQQKAEFFPETGTGVEIRTGDAEETGDFVTIRWNNAPFTLTDVPRSAWFAPYVRDVANKEIMQGYKDINGRPTGIFGPERNVSIEELVKMAVVAAGIQTQACAGELKNTEAKGRWSEAYFLCAEEKGYAIFSDGTIDPLRQATRAEVVATILQAFNVQPKPVLETDTTFSDVPPSIQFSSSILTASADGVIGGYMDSKGRPTGIFGPSNPINRAEMSKMLSIAGQLYKR